MAMRHAHRGKERLRRSIDHPRRIQASFGATEGRPTGALFEIRRAPWTSQRGARTVHETQAASCSSFPNSGLGSPLCETLFRVLAQTRNRVSRPAFPNGVWEREYLSHLRYSGRGMAFS